MRNRLARAVEVSPLAVVALAYCVLGLAACGSSGDTGTGPQSTGVSAGVKFADCMRGLGTSVSAGACSAAPDVAVHASARRRGVPRSAGRIATVQPDWLQPDSRNGRVHPRDPELDRSQLAAIQAGRDRVQLRTAFLPLALARARSPRCATSE